MNQRFAAVRAHRFASLLAFSAALGAFSACGGAGSPAPTPPTPPPPTTLTFSGSVKFGNAGLAGVEVVLSGDASKSTVTDSQGAFYFASLSGSRFVVTPLRSGYNFAPPTYQLGSTSRTDLLFTAAVKNLDVGDTVPDFTLRDQNGQAVSLSSYRGKVVLFDFSADWCGDCRVEAPQLEALYQEYKDRGLQILTILTQGSAAVWASTYNLSYPVLEDPSESVYGPYATGWLPLNVILDRTMIIRYKDKDQSYDTHFEPAAITAEIKKYL